MYKMIDEWVKVIELIDERNRHSDDIRYFFNGDKSKGEMKTEAKKLEGYLKKFKSLITDILNKDYKILFMVTTVKHVPEMRKQGYQSKKRGFIIDGNDYYVPNYYANQKDKNA